MPELPEVECVRRSLLPVLVGATVEDAQLLRRDVLRDPDTGRKGNVDPSRLLLGASLVEPTRLGKHLALRALDRRVLEVHLGMSGQVLLSRTPLDTTHAHARWILATPAGERWHVLFRDPRRFGGLWAFDSERNLLASRWRSLGPDALTITSEHLANRAGSSTRALKAVLLDQSLLAGVGNIYADEALFLAKLHPKTRCTQLRPRHWSTLAEAIRHVLATAIAAGGSTLRDYTAADGTPGSMQLAHHVYARAGERCTQCQTTTIQAATIAQRTSSWCPTCQPRRPA